MSLVSLIRHTDYDQPGLSRALERCLEPLGGMERFVKPGQTVLIKPNMLGAAEPDKCHTTHPALVVALGSLVQKAGGELVIGDSPAIDPFKKVARKSGLEEAARTLGARLSELKDPTPAKTPAGSLYASLEIARLALETDVVINLPKLKTHGQMLMTLGVKNLFGCIVGQRKAAWHHQAGLDRMTFANLLMDIWGAVNPGLTVLDGIWGMEGRGPANGNPRPFNLLAASDNALHLDLAVCQALEVPLKRFPLYRVALERGLISPELSELSLAGDDPGQFGGGIDLPKLDAMNILPGWLDRMARHQLVAKPVQEPEDCEACMKCMRICPAKCLSFEGKKARFDYDACIRCYCCQEVCPQNAISFKQGLLVRIMNLLRP